MAMSLSLSPASDALPAHSQQHGGVNTNNNSSNNLSVSINNNSTSNGNLTTDSQIPPSTGAKRKSSRRANTAERRATHNAVERQRRETLNGRFIDLATLLPNLSQIRRPSKSSIVNSSIAHIQASRRHRLTASRELKMLKLEADALRREVNEWRDRAGLPRVDEAPRGDGFAMVITGELEVIQGIAIEEEDEDAEDGFGIVQHTGAMPCVPHHSQQQAEAYNPAYMAEVDEEVAILDAMYAQQQQQQQQTIQQQMQFSHPIMPPQTHEFDDPRMAAMLSFAQNGPQPVVPSAGYPSVNTRPTAYTNGTTNWVPSQAAGFASGHLLTPPSTSHGLSTDSSPSGSPVGGISANGSNMSSPASTTSTLSSFSSGSVVPSHHPFRRERSGSLTGSSPGSQSPAYELHATRPAMQDFTGVPRMGGASFVPSHVPMFGQGHGMQVQPPSLCVGGGGNPLMMMMM